MGAGNSSQRQIHGFCQAEYEPVKKHLEKMVNERVEENVQVCAFVHGKCVLDLYSGVDQSYNSDKMQSIFSSGKSFESIVLGMLHSKGLFQFEDKITKFWPEFGQNGKDQITIEDVLRHESGLAWFKKSIPSIEDAWTENLKCNKVGELIEMESQHFPVNSDTNTRLEYHALTRGLILNEIVRRIDPKKRTIGEIMREEVNIDGILVGVKGNQNNSELIKIHRSKANDF